TKWFVSFDHKKTFLSGTPLVPITIYRSLISGKRTGEKKIPERTFNFPQPRTKRSKSQPALQKGVVWKKPSLWICCRRSGCTENRKGRSGSLLPQRIPGQP